MSKKSPSGFPGERIAAGVALGAVAVGAAALVVGSQCLQLVRTKAGMARVKKVRDAEGNAVRVLQQGGVYQSATYLDERRFEPVFAYYRAFDRMFDAEGAMSAATGHGIDRVLVMGGGGYAYPKHALTERVRLEMDVVEIDPAVTRLARRWFYLDDLEAIAGARLGLIADDARSYVSRALAEGRRYDAIVNDCFSGAEPVRPLSTVEALCQAKVCLNPGGLYLANVVSESGGEDVSFLRDVMATAAAVFAHVHVVPCEDASFAAEDNYLVIATDGEYAFEGELEFGEGVYGSVMRDA